MPKLVIVPLPGAWHPDRAPGMVLKQVLAKT